MEGGPSIQDDENLLTTSSRSGIFYRCCPCFNDSASDDEEETPMGRNDSTGCCYTFCDPRGTGHRFIALIFMCFLGFGSYFCYDNPAALENHMITDLNITSIQYGMFNSMYSWPNVILCFVGGFLIDRVFGIRLGTNIYMALTLLGQFVFASGVYINEFWIMILGRFIFGIGAESLAVAQNNYAVLWFKGKELNMVFGLQLSFARVGSTVNFWVMESIYTWINQGYKGPEGLGLVLLLAGTTCIFSMICALILSMMDKRAERILQRNVVTNSEDVVRLTDVKDFKATFWFLTIICVFYYVAIFPFISYGKNFFKDRFNMTDQQANNIDSLVYLISGIASPFLGFMVDKLGKNLVWITTAVALTIAAHCILAFTLWNPYIGMVLMGIAYSCLASSLWPLVSLIIPEYQLGTAYGVCQAVQNLGLAVFSILAGLILEKLNSYTWLEVFFIISLGIAFIANILLWILDAKRGGLLNMSAWKRHELAALDNAADKECLLQTEERTSSEGLEPNSDFHIRNRYLSRIGAPLPDSYNIQKKSLAYKALR